MPYEQFKAITDDVGNFVAQFVTRETKSQQVAEKDLRIQELTYSLMLRVIKAHKPNSATGLG